MARLLRNISLPSYAVRLGTISNLVAAPLRTAAFVGPTLCRRSRVYTEVRPFALTSSNFATSLQISPPIGVKGVYCIQ